MDADKQLEICNQIYGKWASAANTETDADAEYYRSQAVAILASHDALVAKEAEDKALRWAKQMIDLHGVELGRAEILHRIAEKARVELQAAREKRG